MRWRDFDSLTALPRSFFDLPRRVHFVGIGGIGMSALALALRARGHFVTGSDAVAGETMSRLRDAGIEVAIGHRVENLGLSGSRAEALIVSTAIAADNPETAADLGLPCWHRGQLLAYFVNSARQAIAVSGTHGKSTTSAMAAHILERCAMNPTAILGAAYPPFGSNARIGDPNLTVVEADESDGSFTLLEPSIAVVTNVEPEHLENYDYNEAELWRAFSVFAAQVRAPAQGGEPAIVLNADDPTLVERLSATKARLATYSTPGAAPVGTEALHLSASQIGVCQGRMVFDVTNGPQTWRQVALGAPGEHNVGNALAAVAAAHFAGAPIEEAFAALADFHGVGRRFQYCGEAGGVVAYDDYAHHPTEVARTLEAARHFLQRPLKVVFQPHRYSRTQQLGADFGPCFAQADEVIVTELYSAFESPIPGVSGRIVHDAVRAAWPGKPLHFVEGLDQARDLLLASVRPGDAVICMGAGDITTLPARLLAGIAGSENGPNPLPNFCRRDEPLSRHTTIKVGGPATVWAEPDDEESLLALLALASRRGWRIQPLGAGSNVIPGDSPIEGCVVKLGGGFNTLRVEGSRLIAGGAALLPKLAHFALANSLGNMEWTCGIPGTVGGSLFGNAGARGYSDGAFAGRDCAADLESLVAYDLDGRRHELARRDVEFSYRKSSLTGLIVTSATFVLPPLSREQTDEHQQAVKDLLRRRRETQPVNAASAGCVWKNPRAPDCRGAGELIERLGLKGFQIGGAQISEVHANFIVNTGDATGKDVRGLIDHVEATVLQQTGIQLEREVRLLGD